MLTVPILSRVCDADDLSFALVSAVIASGDPSAGFFNDTAVYDETSSSDSVIDNSGFERDKIFF